MQHGAYIRRVSGSDTAVLMVHGIVGTPRHFDGIIPAVPESWSVYNILLEGHGGTACDFARSSMAKWRKQVKCTLAELCREYKRVYIVAHSMGTLLVMEAEQELRGRVEAMLLLAAPMKVGVKPRTVLYALQAAFGLVKEGSGAELMLRDSGVEITWKLWRYLGWIPRYLELFRQIRLCRGMVENIGIPCCAIQSKRDELVSRAAAKYLAVNPRVEIHELEHSGHFGYVPEELEFIKKKAEEMFKEGEK